MNKMCNFIKDTKYLSCEINHMRFFIIEYSRMLIVALFHPFCVLALRRKYRVKVLFLRLGLGLGLR